MRGLAVRRRESRAEWCPALCMWRRGHLQVRLEERAQTQHTHVRCMFLLAVLKGMHERVALLDLDLVGGGTEQASKREDQDCGPQ